MESKFAKVVSSSWIDKVVYLNGNLYIETKANKVYMFEAVPIDVADGLISAESPGKYFHEHIKNVYNILPS